MGGSSKSWIVAGTAGIVLSASGGFALYLAETRQVEALVQRDLNSIAKLKAEQIAAWRSERLADASVLLDNPVFPELARQWLAAPSPRLKEQIDARLTPMREHNGYSDIQIADSVGRIRLSLSGQGGLIDAAERQTLSEALKTGRPALCELHRSADGEAPRITAVVPLFQDGETRSGAGGVLLQMPAAAGLYPLVAAWPYEARSAETMLIRRDGDSVQYLSPLKNRHGKELKLRIPLTRTELAAAAVQGRMEEVRSETDYRGVPVYAAAATIRNSPWFLVAKIDRAEALERWRDQPSILLGAHLALMAAVLLGIALAWQKSKKDIYRKLHAVAEKRLEDEQYFHLLLDHVPAGVVALGPDGRFDFCNRTACEYLGLGPEQILGQPSTLTPHWRFCRPDGGLLKPEEYPVGKVQASGQPCEDVTLGVLAPGAGTPKWMLCNFYPLGGQAGSPRRVLVSFLDITKRKQAEEALEASEVRLQQALRAADIGIFEFNYQTGTFYGSDRLRALFQVSADEPFTYEFLLKTAHPEDRQKIVDLLQRAEDPRGDGVVSIEHRIVMPDGTTRWLRVRAQIYFEGEGPNRRALRSAGACVDITSIENAMEERERLQIELLQAKKLESIGRLAGGVAHEFNNLLTVINGYAERLVDHLPAGGPARKWAVEIGAAGDRAAELATQLLAFGRKQITRPAPLDLNRIVLEAVKILDETIGEDIRLETRLAPQLARIEADHDQMLQMLMNLALNARDAIEGEGTIEIETCVAQVSEREAALHADRRPGQYVVLGVRDTGCGMPPEVLDKIFEPFYTTKPQGCGTGLSLPSVYGMVQQNGGWIEVRSEVHRGTSFRVFLPAGKPQTSKVGSNTEREMGRSEEKTILVVEDQQALLELARTMLEMHGYRVLGATSGAEALALEREFADEIHLLLTDVMMPGMKGDELYNRLRTVRPGIKVLFMTGHSEEKLAGRGMPGSGGDCIQKPFREKVLTAKVAEALSSVPEA